MSDLEPGKMSGPGAGGPEKKPNQLLIRIGVWVVVGGVGLYLVISGIVGILAKR